MISVPDAGLLPSTPRPVLFMNGSITSSGKPCGYVGNGDGRDDAHQLPVPCRRVLALRALDQPPGDRRRARLRRAALERLDVAETERLEIGQVEPADGAGDVPERVRALVPVVRCVRQLPRADGVEHDDARARHCGYLTQADGGHPRDCSASVRLHRLGDPRALGRGHVCSVIRISPSQSAKQQVERVQRRGLGPSGPRGVVLRGHRRQRVRERRVRQPVRLGHRRVRDLAGDHVDALCERRIVARPLPPAPCRRSPRRTAASRS